MPFPLHTICTQVFSYKFLEALILKYLFILILSCSGLNVFSQADSTEAWIDILSASTVSFGKDTTKEFRENGGGVTKKRVFETIGAGVLFYVKYFKEKDTIAVPCIITAKHVIYDEIIKYSPRSLNIRYKLQKCIQILRPITQK